MQIKISNTIIDSSKEPIMLILTARDKELISSMHPDSFKYCVFPEEASVEKIKEFMEVK